VSQNRVLVFLLIVSAALAVLVSPHASRSPDGLERVAEDNAFAEQGSVLVDSPIPDYSVPGIANSVLSTSAAGLLGVVVVFLGTLLIGRGLAAVRKET